MLITARIGEHQTIGLVTPGLPATAVCLLEGTRVCISPTPAMTRDFHLSAGAAMATFMKRDLPETTMVGYRDGFVFDDAPETLHLLQDFDLDVVVELAKSEAGAEPELERELVLA